MIPEALFSGLLINKFTVAPKTKPSLWETNFSKEKTKKQSASPLIHVVDSEESPGESGGFAEGNQERGVDFSLRVDEDTAEEKNQSTCRKDKGGY